MPRPFSPHPGPSRHRILVITGKRMVVEIAGKEWEFQIQPIEPSQSSRNAHRPHFHVFCPITNRAKGYPFELAVPAGLPVSGVVLCDHVRSQDWRERQWQPLCTVSAAFLQAVLARTLTLFDLPSI